MTLLLCALTLLTAIAAGVRGIWSPCGLSMLSTITPIGERGRGNQFRQTATWYVLGATVGGLSLGTAIAGATYAAGRLSVSSGVAGAVVAVAGLVAMASDARVGGFQVPMHRRQVNERWLDRYRAWVYGGGFGWEIGSGLCTYIMTAAYYLLVVLAVVCCVPAVALVAGGLFGLTRGLAVLLGRNVREAGALRLLHCRIQETGPRIRDAMVTVELVVATAAALLLGPVVAYVAAIVGLAIFVGSSDERRLPACSLDANRSDRSLRQTGTVSSNV